MGLLFKGNKVCRSPGCLVPSRKELPSLVHDAIQDLHNASTIVAACGVCLLEVRTDTLLDPRILTGTLILNPASLGSDHKPFS